MLVKKIFPICLHAAAYSRVGAQNPTEWDTSVQILTGILLSLPRDLTFVKDWCHNCPDRPTKKLKHTAGCIRSRHLTCFEEKVAGFLAYCFYCLRDLTSETLSPISKVISPGFKQRKDSFFFWYVFHFHHKGTRDLLVGPELFEHKKWKKKKNKVTLMSANLRFSVTCAVSNVWGCPYKANHASQLVWSYWRDKCNRLEHTGQWLWQQDEGCVP